MIGRYLTLVALLIATLTISAAEPRTSLTFGGNATTSWDSAANPDTFNYGATVGLAFENVGGSPFELGIRQSVYCVDEPTVETTETQVEGESTTVTTTYTKPHVPVGHGYGWWRNHRRAVTYEIPGDTTIHTTTVVGTDRVWFGSTALYGGANLPLCKLVTLYGGASIGVQYGEGSGPIYYGGPEGGIKVGLTADTYAFGRVNYDFRISDRVGNEGDLLRYNAGIGIRF